MNKDTSIWMPIYIGDLQAKFARMNAEQVGATLLLMMDYWKNGTIPNQPEIITSITKLSATKTQKLIQTLISLNLFECSGEQLTSLYIMALKEQAMLNQKMKTEKAKNAAQARWEGVQNSVSVNLTRF